jgi:N-acetylglucosamine-6-phosphate deacetylase
MNEPQAIVGAGVVQEDGVLYGKAVLIRDGGIEAIVGEGEVPADYSRHVVESGLLAPGFVDVHAHGAAQRGFNESDSQAYRTALDVYLAAGITTVLPTLSSAPLDEMLGGIEAFESVRSEAGLPHVPGVHLEGPYFAQAQRGAQDTNALRSPDDGSVGRVLEHSDAIRMISYAPELPGAVALTERLVSAGIVAAAGHSDCRDTDLAACQRAGLSHVIHIVSGQSVTVREGAWRKPGLLEATLASDDLTVEMIADGKHLPDTLMRLAYRCLAGRLCLVSDATPAAGLPEGSVYRLGAREYVVDGGVGMTLDRTSFAGSTTLISAMLPLARRVLATTIPQAVAMVTAIPARAARLTDVGRIAPGYRADFVVLDQDLAVTSVALAGTWR